MEKLVVYFSKSGNTKMIAERIEQQHLVKYHRIQPDQPYPDEFRKLQAVSQDEVLFGKTRAIKGIDRDLWEKYSEVIIGTPTYWGHLPACVCQFLKENDFSSNRKYLRFDDNNTIIKMLKAYKEKYNIEDNFQIYLEKYIPSQAGLAGGSADAASTLRLLEKTYKRKPGKILTNNKTFDDAVRQRI